MHDTQAVREVLARYVRAADRRDPEAMADLYLDTAKVEITYNDSGTIQPLGELVGKDAIRAAVAGMMQPHPPRGASHHTTFDHIIEFDGDRATIDAQFIVYGVQGEFMPESGWPSGAQGAQGTIRPIEAGYYRPTLLRTPQGWKIETQRIEHNLPMAFPRS